MGIKGVNRMADMVTLETYRQMESKKDKKIADLEKVSKELQRKIDQLQGFLDHDIEYDIEQENLRLKEYIEKMKCCQNCKNWTWNMSNKKCQFRCESREACNNWELVE